MAQHLGSGGMKAGSSYMPSHVAGTSGENKPVRSIRPVRAFVAFGAACVSLTLAYFLGAQHFQTHFVPGTTVGGINASWLTVDDLAEQVEARMAEYTHDVSGDGLEFTLGAADVGLAIDGRAWAQEALDSVSDDIWFVDALVPRHLEPTVGATLDEEKLTETVQDVVGAFNETAEPPTDASAHYDPEADSFVIEPEALGTEVSAEAVAKLLSQDMLRLRNKTTLGEDQLQRPLIAADNEELLAATEEANTMLAKEFIMTLDGDALPIDPVDSRLSSGWIEVVNEGEHPSAVVDEHAIWQWSWDNLNAVVNGENEVRTWEVDSGATANILAHALHDSSGGRTEVATVTMAERPYESEGHELRGRHIDVNLSTQYARLYDTDGKTVLWRSYIVSGNVNTGHGTVTGEFTIDNRDLDIVLVGADEDEDGEPDYRSPVRYWMGFYLNSYGFHDADWRWEDYFGGDIYLWDGSHGCVNLPVSKAAELWDLTDYGEKVYIHW